ncbi:MAG TPA: hypothetical protein VF676_04245 [Flavobacterium sp.]|jgi:translation elongation factor EF-Tu-like GTPase
MMTTRPHFLALLTFAPDDQGSRTPASSGHRAELKFSFAQTLVMSSLNFVDVELVFPGDTVSAEITLLNADAVVESIYEGMDFELIQGSVSIGTGVIKKLLS